MEYLFMVIFIITAGLTDGLQWYQYYRARGDEISKCSWWWHNTQLLERVFAISFGISLGWHGWETIKIVLLASAVFWIIYDGIIRLTQGRSFFYTDKKTTAITKYFDMWYVKISYLALTIALIKYF